MSSPARMIVMRTLPAWETRMGVCETNSLEDSGPSPRRRQGRSSSRAPPEPDSSQLRAPARNAETAALDRPDLMGVTGHALGGQASEQASGCGGPGRHRQLGRQISSKAHHCGQWQSRVSLRCRRQPGRRSLDHPNSDSQWQVSDRRYLSEGSMALLTETTREVVPAQLMPA